MSSVVKFVCVGAGGFAVQILMLATLTRLARWPWLPATVVAVECAIVHNFVWHVRWTWKDRLPPSAWLHGFVRFNAGTVVTSIGGNVVLMALFVGILRIPVIVSNVLAVGVMSAANFLFADRWVFRPIAALTLLLIAAPDVSAAPSAATLGAWNAYVARTEAQLDAMRSAAPCEQPRGIAAEGETIDVGDGTISDWRGFVFIRGVTIDRLLARLQHPGTPPPQEDVVDSRVLARGTDSLRVYIRLVRHAIVTVTYDTEHEMTFQRWAPALATARSVATKIEEVGGGDRGFLWRLHSYWRYDQVGDGVVVSLRSLTLSRDVPRLIKPIAGRIVPRIARESVIRTLEALKRYAEQASLVSW